MLLVWRNDSELHKLIMYIGMLSHVCCIKKVCTLQAIHLLICLLVCILR